jgi:hypothetical protein
VKPSQTAKDKLVDRTRQIWQSRVGRELSTDDARQITDNIAGFFAVLTEWSQAEKPRVAEDFSEPAPSVQARRRAMNVEPDTKSRDGQATRDVGQRA